MRGISAFAGGLAAIALLAIAPLRAEGPDAARGGLYRDDQLVARLENMLKQGIWAGSFVEERSGQKAPDVRNNTTCISAEKLADLARFFVFPEETATDPMSCDMMSASATPEQLTAVIECKAPAGVYWHSSVGTFTPDMILLDVHSTETHRGEESKVHSVMELRRKGDC